MKNYFYLLCTVLLGAVTFIACEKSGDVKETESFDETVGIIHNKLMHKAFDLTKEAVSKHAASNQKSEFDVESFYTDVLYPEVIVKHAAELLGENPEDISLILTELGFTGNLQGDNALDYNLSGNHQALASDLIGFSSIDQLPVSDQFLGVKDSYQDSVGGDVLDASVSVALHTNTYWTEEAGNWESVLNESNAKGGCIGNQVVDADIGGAIFGGILGGLAGACVGALTGSLTSCISQIIRC